MEKLERGDLGEVLTCDREGRRQLDLEVAADNVTWTAAARCDRVELLRRQEAATVMRLGVAEPVVVCLGPAAELDAGGTSVFLRTAIATRLRTHQPSASASHLGGGGKPSASAAGQGGCGGRLKTALTCGSNTLVK
jgi:hypothetical protein